ncbi:MAG: tRNA (guanosine(37)-N1)-methyltransferase TrmD [Tissierellia bacterium]|nr:tRNA (guanosine(37)-N1)-methyltransferase TrmD [Tissierellia bacterium]
MVINCLTTFPEFVGSIREYSMVRRAYEKNLVDIRTYDLRDYSLDPNRRTDDYPYGGGQGMLMTCQPIVDALQDVKEKGKVIYLSPHGQTLNQEKLKSLATLSEITILCGHYEGVDQRVIDHYVDEEISVGDYVLTGGEIPAMLLIDGIVRLLPGLLRTETSYEEESFYHGLLEHSQYTRPYNFRGLKVPDILLSGHHEKVKEFNLDNAIIQTLKRRPDLIDKILNDVLTDETIKERIQKLRKEDPNESY